MLGSLKGTSPWTGTLAFLISLNVLWLCSLPSPCTAREVVLVLDGNNTQHDNEMSMRCQGESLLIGCGYRETVKLSDVHLRYTNVTPPQSLPLTISTEVQLFRVMSYNLPASSATGYRQYQCVWNNIQHNVTIHFDMSSCKGTPTDTTTDPPTEPNTGTGGTTGTTDTTTNPTTTKPTEPNTGTGGTTVTSPTDSHTMGGGATTSGATFKGLKPLIYTVASVILLGTLAIVAIITCWIRARRSFHNRVIRPNNTPQDYLDYISDNEFTPLTTSEFMASLQERPPTYNQSEEMIQQTDETGSENAQGPSSTETGRDSAVQSGGTQNTSTTNEGTLVERRRQRVSTRERQRRRRRVVIVENGEGQSGESSVTLASVAPGQAIVTQEEGPSQGEGAAGHQPAQPQAVSSSNASGGDSAAGGNNATVLVNLQLPSFVMSAEHSSAQASSSPHTPTQQEIEAIESCVNMLEVLSSPPFNSHRIAPSASGLTAADSSEASENSQNNLIDFSSPLPSTLPTALDLDSL